MFKLKNLSKNLLKNILNTCTLINYYTNLNNVFWLIGKHPFYSYLRNNNSNFCFLTRSKYPKDFITQLFHTQVPYLPIFDANSYKKSKKYLTNEMTRLNKIPKFAIFVSSLNNRELYHECIAVGILCIQIIQHFTTKLNQKDQNPYNIHLTKTEATFKFNILHLLLKASLKAYRDVA